MSSYCFIHKNKVGEYRADILIERIWETHLVCYGCYRKHKKTQKKRTGTS